MKKINVGEDMSKREDIEIKTEQLILPILEARNFDLWDVEYVKEGQDYYLRAYIDKEGGITIDDCVDVSRELSDKLDVDDFIEEAYILEVSSPGLGRVLKKDKELSRCIGLDVDIKTYKPIDNCKDFTGCLKSFTKDNIVIENEAGELDFARSDIAVIKLSLNIV